MVSTAAQRRIWLSRRRRRKKGAMDGSSKEQPRLGRWGVWTSGVIEGGGGWAQMF